MKHLFTIVALFFSLINLQGCTSVSKAGYYWGKYSETYLAVVRKPSKDTTQQHISELREILSVSEEKGLRPPPGICAELAFYLSQLDKQGNQDEIEKFYQCEMTTYPESKIFIERLTSQNL